MRGLEKLHQANDYHNRTAQERGNNQGEKRQAEKVAVRLCVDPVRRRQCADNQEHAPNKYYAGSQQHIVTFLSMAIAYRMLRSGLLAVIFDQTPEASVDFQRKRRKPKNIPLGKNRFDSPETVRSSPPSSCYAEIAVLSRWSQSGQATAFFIAVMLACRSSWR